MKFVVLGSSGMLGSYMTSYLKKVYPNINVATPSKIEFDIFERVATSSFLDTLLLNPGDVLLGCTGVINNINPSLRESIIVNSVFPCLAARYCYDRDIRFIHFTTDCVYDGKKGDYSTKDKHTAIDTYGITKSCGEIHEMCILIRTSIIGESKNGRSLVEWLRSQKGKVVTGYQNHRWNGVTCLELAKIIVNIVETRVLSGIFVVTSPEPVSKYELCTMIKEAFQWNLHIEKGEYIISIDRTLKGTIISQKSIKEQILEMVEYK